MIRYSEPPEDLEADDLQGFFVGWPDPPTSEQLLRLLRRSDFALLAWSQDRVVGYVTALSDGVLFSSITSLEVLPDYQGGGIGRELMVAALEALGDLYATDLVCDPEVAPFYESVGMVKLQGMGVRRYGLLEHRW